MLFWIVQTDDRERKLWAGNDGEQRDHEELDWFHGGEAGTAFVLRGGERQQHRAME